MKRHLDFKYDTLVFEGAISCTHDNDLQLEEKNFLMRKSMKKFKNENQKFCVNTKKFIGTEKSQIFLFFLIFVGRNS